jgi:hypothetical protein
LIHMNGRLYDPELGRMLSPDPFVQIPEFSQNFNRYSYVLNNPLNLTDPSGFSIVGSVLGGFGFHTKAKDWVRENWRTVVVIVVVAVLTYFTAGAAAAWGAGLYASATGAAVGGAAATAFGGAVAGGYIGAVAGGLGAALNGGNLGDVLRGALIGGVQGAITGGVLSGLEQAPGVFNAQTAVHVAGHGVVGGAANVAMGGKFSDGFLSAAVSAAAGNAGLLGEAGTGGFGGLAARTVAAGVVGGTVSVLGGGKFANGAYTAAFQHLLNMEFQKGPDGKPDYSLPPNMGQPTDPTIAIAGIYAETVAFGGIFKAFGAAFRSLSANSGVQSSANALRFKAQLAFEEAGILTRGGAGLTDDAIKAATEIPISGGKFKNKAVINELTSNGSNIANWGKFSTESVNLPSGQSSQIHFYKNRITHEVNLNIDFKVKSPIK